MGWLPAPRHSSGGHRQTAARRFLHALLILGWIVSAASIGATPVAADHADNHLGDGTTGDTYVRLDMGSDACQPGYYPDADNPTIEAPGPVITPAGTAWSGPYGSFSCFAGPGAVHIGKTFGQDAWVRIAGSIEHGDRAGIECNNWGHGTLTLQVDFYGGSTHLSGPFTVGTVTDDGAWDGTGYLCNGGTTDDFDVTLAGADVPHAANHMRLTIGRNSGGTVGLGITDLVVVESTLGEPELPGEPPPPADPCDWVAGESIPNLTECLAEGPEFNCEHEGEFWELWQHIGWLACEITEYLAWIIHAIVESVQFVMALMAWGFTALLAALGEAIGWLGEIAGAVAGIVGGILGGLVDAITTALEWLFVPTGFALGDFWDVADDKVPIGYMVQVTAFLGAVDYEGGAIDVEADVMGSPVTLPLGWLSGLAAPFRPILAGLIWLLVGWTVWGRVRGAVGAHDS